MLKNSKKLYKMSYKEEWELKKAERGKKKPILDRMLRAELEDMCERWEKKYKKYGFQKTAKMVKTSKHKIKRILGGL